MKFVLWILLTAIITTISYCQNTVGLLSNNKEKSYDGYTLIYPHNQPHVFLINNCGEIVQTWRDSSIYRPGNTAYITKDAKLIKAKRKGVVVNDPIWYGGGGAIVEIRDWDNNLEWSFEINDSLYRMHHDIKVMPNGNILLLVWEKKTKEQLIAAGRDTSKYKEDVLTSEIIMEINPKTNKIEWQWDLWDHIIQDYDASKPNYGNVALNAGKIDINYDYIRDGSWFHINAIDYNEELDQILISCPTYNEIWIIDHSTTTAQAKTSIGGFSGVGGDLMYRWGNPSTYKSGNQNNQLSHYQHGVHWARNFLAATSPDYGKIVIFNNRATDQYSQVNIIEAPWDMYEWTYTKTQGIWGPFEYNKTIKHPEETKLFSNILSNAQILPNQNILVLSGRSGYIFETTQDNEIVWEYKVPLKNGLPVPQKSNININDNTNFRANKYPITFEAFVGKNLSPKGFIELNPDENYCEKLVGVGDINETARFKVYPNPAIDFLVISSKTNSKVSVTNIMGNFQMYFELLEGENRINISSIPSGTFIITDLHTSERKLISITK